MKRYEVLLEGLNYLIKENNEEFKIGFFVTKCVEANSSDEAKNKSVALVEYEIFSVKKGMYKSEISKIIIDSIYEVNECPDRDLGYSFFND